MTIFWEKSLIITVMNYCGLFHSFIELFLFVLRMRFIVAQLTGVWDRYLHEVIHIRCYYLLSEMFVLFTLICVISEDGSIKIIHNPCPLSRCCWLHLILLRWVANTESAFGHYHAAMTLSGVLYRWTAISFKARHIVQPFYGQCYSFLMFISSRSMLHHLSSCGP